MLATSVREAGDFLSRAFCIAFASLLLEVFNRFDQSGDGKLDMRELWRPLECMPPTFTWRQGLQEPGWPAAAKRPGGAEPGPRAFNLKKVLL